MSQEGPQESESALEKGRNVRMVLRFIRHGERTAMDTEHTKKGELTDYGRQITEEKARTSGIQKEDFDAVKAYGSNAGPKREVAGRGRKPLKMGRSLETPDIYAKEIAGVEAGSSRPRKTLSYEPLKSPSPYDHERVYNSALPQDFEDLPPEEQAPASKIAQTAAVDALFAVHTPEANAYKREMAGSYASFILHKEEMARRLKSGSEVLFPSGTHGGMIEPALQQMLVRKMENGEEIHGFKSVEEIGGGFDPSESFDVEITTDAEGNFGPLHLKWEKDSQRPSAPEMYLDPDRVKELAAYYKELHPKQE